MADAGDSSRRVSFVSREKQRERWAEITENCLLRNPKVHKNQANHVTLAPITPRCTCSILWLALPLIAGIIILAPSIYLPAPRLLLNHLRPRPKATASWSPIHSSIPTSITAGRLPLTTATMAPSQLRKPPQAPPLFTGTPSSILADTKRLIEQSRKVQDDVAANVGLDSAIFEKVVLPLAHDENSMALESHILGFYQSVSTDASLRDASTEAEKLMDDFAIESAMREDLFKLVDAVLKKGEKLDPESKRLLEKEHKEYIRNGLGLPAGPKRDRFKEIKKRLSQIAIEFQKNLNEEKGGVWLTREELHGVPEDVVSGLKKGEGENEGKLFLTFKYPDLFPLTKYATNADVRKRVMIANENKCNQNVPLFREAIVLRDEGARLLGYPNHATFRIEDKMAKTPETVDKFLGDLRARLKDGGLKEIEKLKDLKAKDLKARNPSQEPDGHYFLWDHRFYDRMMLEKDYLLDHQQIAEFFPLHTTIRGMLMIFEELFGLVFVEIEGEERSKLSETGKGDDIVWHEDVQVFSVWNDEGEGNGFVGYLYLDLFPREGKYGHAANFNLQPGFTDKDGKRRYPATALVCNFSKPTAKKPSLLKHEEVVTLFHELGHGIHDLVSKTTYSRFHGTNTVRDFVEAPSQMLENWCWTPSQLKSLSKHYSYLSPEYLDAWKEQAGDKPRPSEHIPDELVANLIRTKHVNDALFNLRQLHFGIFDMTVHEPASHAEIQNLKITEKYNSLRKEITGLDGPEILGLGYDWGHGQATFGHLIGGYDAGYYGYLSSQVYSADIFYTVFKENPMNRKEGRRYRYTVLEKGGSQEEMETLKEFLGREPKPDAFYKELGLA
ncbi:metalloendopeptidase [Emydomyces testavorans]|uniref:Metalloendopeptidase n=1 Tax=Emydomyces testavorans TaxID=2070801 RepID=A0AAF0DLC3_9EURO|nr:metalloendopeptidase [Emydomyces testavorans]